MYYEFNGLATKTTNNSSKIINFIDRIKYSPNSILQEIKHFLKISSMLTCFQNTIQVHLMKLQTLYYI